MLDSRYWISSSWTMGLTEHPPVSPRSQHRIAFKDGVS